MTEQKKTTDVDRQIDDNLKRVYQAAASEPLPDKFLSLIAQLKAQEGGGQTDAG